MNIFLYGTLRHEPLMQVVLGMESSTETRPDVLPDHAVMAVEEGDYPLIMAAPGQRAAGLVLSGLSEAAVARLDFYEIGFGYTLREMVLESGATAMVYFPDPTVDTPTEPWDFEVWAEKWGPLAAEAAGEAMRFFGQITPDDLVRVFPRMRARAQSRLNARNSNRDPETLQGEVKVHSKHQAYSNFFALEEFTLAHETFSGGMSAPMDRAVFLPTDAALVLPYDPVRDRVLVVEQIRMGPLARGDTALWQLEPVAGLIDPGETPHSTAMREAVEEAGLHLDHLEFVSEGYTSPGASADYQYLYVGLCALPDDTQSLGGLASEGEDIRSHILPFETLIERADAGKLTNAPLTLITHWLARHRGRLRSG